MMTLKLENIGRHILGKKYIGLNKANAIIEYIKEQVGNNGLFHSLCRKKCKYN